MTNLKTSGTALAVMGLCAAARRRLNRTGRQDREYCKGWLRLTALWNRGAAFGLPVPRAVLPAVSAAALGAVWLCRARCPAGAGLILGGGASNLLERLSQGAVYDYAQFPKAPKPLRRFVFNLADLAVLAGSAGLCLFGKEQG